MNLLFDAVRLLVAAFFGATTLHHDAGLATRYGTPGDRWAGRGLACTGKRMQPNQLVCAHRTLPCGTTLILENPRNGRFALCQVLDRGPYGAILPSGQWGLKIHASDPGRWRGILDLSPAVSKALGHNGFQRIRVYYQRVASHLHYARERPRRRH